MLTKTDFLRYLEAPMHLWAAKHDQLTAATPSHHDQHLMAQGIEVEGLAQEYLNARIEAESSEAEVQFQPVYVDGSYYARMDAAVYYPDEDVWDIYEIKSASSVRKEHLFDAAFQRLIAEANLNVRHTNILHVNKQYRRQGEVDLSQLFVIENVDEQTAELRPEMLAGREAAWAVAEADSPEQVERCVKPKTCLCPELCHPALPSHSIYDLPRMRAEKLRQLRDAGILAAADIPVDFPLSDTQKRHAETVRTRKPAIDREAIRASLDELVYPLYFLDYETYNPAVPWFDGYGPYQQMVFQYSLHVFESPEAEAVHYEFLAEGPGDPGEELAASLVGVIGERGSVVVWNKSFEGGRNKEMAQMYPQYADRLENINTRLYDLMEIFSKGRYIHPDFHGSASIKNVLPVLVKDLSYDGLPIPAGDEAMMAWIELIKGDLPPADAETIRENLLRYCELDTLAMVENWKALVRLCAE